MPIQFACPHCGARTDVDDQFAGQSGPCAQCGTTVTVPSAEAAQLAEIYQPAARSRGGSWLLPLLMGMGLLLLCSGVLVALLYPVYSNQTSVITQQTACATTLRGIGVALHNYHASHGVLPPAITFDDQGRPMHSWRVLLLPQMQRPDLFNRYDLNQPWDSPQNSQLQAEIGEVYRCPQSGNGPESGLTDFALLTGVGTISVDGKSISFREISDGLSNTILAVEVLQSDIAATEPRDITVAELISSTNAVNFNPPRQSQPFLIHLLMADGKVVAVRNQPQQYDLHSLATPAGGETVAVPQ